MAGFGTKPKDVKGNVVLKKNGDFQTYLPTYVDFEEIFAALEKVRKANKHGYGYNEPVKKKAAPAPEPAPAADAAPAAPAAPAKPEKTTAVWANMEDTVNGVKTSDYTKDAGDGAPVPYIMEEYPIANPKKPTRIVGGGNPKRSNCVTATFDALAIALARGMTDKGGEASGGNVTPYTRNGRLNMDCYRKWFAISGDDDGVKAILYHNLGVSIAPKKARRGDVVQINWQNGGSHCTYCWDSHWDGKEIFIQAISSQTMTNGVDVIPSLEEFGAFAKQMEVLRHEKQGKEFVIARSRTDDWLTTHAARAHFRRFGAWMRETGDPNKLDTGLLMSNFLAARFHRLFPRYPIALAGSIEVSSIQGGGADAVQHHRTRESSSELYFDNNESAKGQPRNGGFFPIGAGRSWHGGVHLYPEADDTAVYAPVDGVVVAARLTSAKNRSEYGDTGFVLLKTTLEIDSKKETFFTLLAHLREPTANEHETVPWLDELLTVPDEGDHRWAGGFDKKKFYYGVLDPPAEAPTTEGRSGDDEDGGLIVFDRADTGPKSKRLGKLAKGDTVEILSALNFNGWAKVKGMTGDLAGKAGWVHGAGRLERVDTHSLDEELKKVRSKIFDGEVVDFSKLARKFVVRVGERVGYAGTIGGERAVHFAVFSKDLIGVNFDPDHAASGKKTKADVEDTDADLYMDRSAFEKRFFDLLKSTDDTSDSTKHTMIKGSTRKEDDLLLGDEIRVFYARNPLRKKMRPLVTRHPSEWGDRVDWSKLDSQPQWKHVDAAKRQHYKDEVKKLIWWTSGLGADAGLPDDQIVYHYHPIEFLKWLDYERDQDTTGSLHASVFELNHEG